MEIIHAAAVSALSGAKMIDATELKNEEIRLVRDSISGRMQEAIDTFTSAHASLVDFLSTKLPQIDERGKDGIFARTRLGDYSYDIV
nr:ABC-three component system middle component 5 [Leisingera sp. ANG-M7]